MSAEYGLFCFRILTAFIHRSSHPEVFCKKVVFINITKVTLEHQCQSLIFNKVAGLRPAILLKKRLRPRCFPVNFAKFLKTPFFIKHLRLLFLIHPGYIHSPAMSLLQFFSKPPALTRLYTFALWS